jgi:hypothetical protein
VRVDRGPEAINRFTKGETMRSQNHTAFAAKTRTGKAITCAIVIAFTAAFYLIYLTAFLVVKDIFRTAVEWWEFQLQTRLVLGLAFDLLILGVLWRYLTLQMSSAFSIGALKKSPVHTYKRGNEDTDFYR